MSYVCLWRVCASRFVAEGRQAGLPVLIGDCDLCVCGVRANPFVRACESPFFGAEGRQDIRFWSRPSFFPF